MSQFSTVRSLILGAALVTLVSPSPADQELLQGLRAQFGNVDISSGESKDSSLVQHDIDDYGNCAFFAKRGVRWSRIFADGSRLELRCDPDRHSLLPGYHLWFSDTRGTRVEIGRCIFDNGFNHGWYYTSADASVNNVVRVEWVNLDGGKNDGGNRRIDRDHYTGPEEPYLDEVRWVFEVAKRRLECTSEKHQYMGAPSLPSHPVDSIDPYVGPAVPELRRSFVKIVD
jgi:hypothetical protein